MRWERSGTCFEDKVEGFLRRRIRENPRAANTSRTGIFALAGAVANQTAGPAVLFSFLIAGVASAAAAFSYAEFAGMIPKAGSAYTYGYAVLGELVGWFIGWDLLLEYTAMHHPSEPINRCSP